MNDEKLQIGQESKPRFEFRTFGQNFDNQWKRMARFSVPVPEDVWERLSDELYIVSRTNDLNNTKIRNGKMDIKTFVQGIEGLEQWNPLMKGSFPMKTNTVVNEVFPAFQVEMPSFEKEEYSLEEFLHIIRIHPELEAVRVRKRRFGYMVNNTICEYAIVLINGARLITMSIESTEISDILLTLEQTGLKNFENINYLQAIKRVIGMIDKPFANETV